MKEDTQKRELTLKAIIAMKTNDLPKIVLGSEIEGSHQVTFDLFGIEPTTLISLVGKELVLSISNLEEGQEGRWN